MSERGQTAYDYLLGIVLLLVTIITVLSLFPQVFGPFVDPVATDREKMADRVAAEIIETNATMDGERTLDIEALDTGDVNEGYLDQLVDRSGVGDHRELYVEIQTGPGERIGDIGKEPPPGEPTATTVRNIRAVAVPGEPQDDCTDGCKLIVRVW